MTTKPIERYFLTLCGALGKLGNSATDVMYQLLTRTDMDDEYVLGAYRIRHGLNMGTGGIFYSFFVDITCHYLSE